MNFTCQFEMRSDFRLDSASSLGDSPPKSCSCRVLLSSARSLLNFNLCFSLAWLVLL